MRNLCRKIAETTGEDRREKLVEAVTYFLPTRSYDPSLDLLDEEDSDIEESKITISVQQRSGRKRITIIAGINNEKNNMKKLLKSLQKLFQCSGSLVVDKTHGNIIMLTGDQRHGTAVHLVRNKICSAGDINICGG